MSKPWPGPHSDVEPGERVALVGHSGAGKSTCANLLLRFWDPDAGSVRLGGIDLRDWPADAVRASVTLVPQEVYLFNISLRDNIRLGRRDATGAEVEAAARQALAPTPSCSPTVAPTPISSPASAAA